MMCHSAYSLRAKWKKLALFSCSLAVGLFQCIAASEDAQTLLRVDHVDWMNASNALSSWKSASKTPCGWKGCRVSPHSYCKRINSAAGLGDTLYEDMEIMIKGHEYKLEYVMAANTVLDLSNNNLTGEIPASIGSLRSLRLLNLSGNHLEGKIPPSIGRIPTLEQLDLSQNELQGNIPEELSNLSMLAVLNVSSNKLCGAIPRGTQFDTFNQSAFQNNQCLCGSPLNKCAKPEKESKKEGNAELNWSVWRNVDEHISVIGLALGFGIGFGGTISLITGWGVMNQ